MEHKDFESALGALEETVKQLEKGDLPLEKSLELFEEGIRLSRFCYTKLDEAERKVEILLKDHRGGLKAVEFQELPEES